MSLLERADGMPSMAFYALAGLALGVAVVQGACVVAESMEANATPEPTATPVLAPASYDLTREARETAYREWALQMRAVPEPASIKGQFHGSDFAPSHEEAKSEPPAPALPPAAAPEVSATVVLPARGALSHGEVLAALASTSWPVELHERAANIAHCESRYVVGAVGDHGRALGLMQIRTDAWPQLAASYDLLDAWGGLEAGYAVYVAALAATGDGWSPWACAGVGE